MFNRVILVIIFAMGLAANGAAQYGNEIYYSDRTIDPADSSSLFLRFGGSAFVNNKEFFNVYQPGYTLIGFYLQPQLEYYPGPSTMLRAGVHLLKYSGLGEFHQAIPTFTVHHSFAPGFELVFGSLYGSLNHGLIEPLFKFERVFTHHNESGLQFLIDMDFIEADIWLNWERFIFTGSPFQEEFTAGFSSTIFPGEREGRFRLELPLQLLATHLGGQIDVSEERLQTLVNFAGGVVAEWDVGGPVVETLGFRGYLAGFADLSNYLRYPYDRGWGLYPNIHVKTRWVEGGLGYWVGNRFVAPRGEPVFQSVSRVDPDVAEAHRELLTAKVIHNRKLVRGLKMGLRFEVYYDHPARQFDHTGGLHIMIDERFFITTLKSR